ncbi:MAG: hypothetical protein AMJ42_02280 [Deltaproteobacteria bacterium DG_8]|nr:MAG: hypothetical protein AMJ42_02280 [Deltaproteobacteria bacterium DG_8]
MDIDELIKEGDALRKKKKYEEALEVLDKAIRIGSSDKKIADILVKIGDNLRKQEKYEEALKAFENTIEIDPKTAHLWNKKGYVLLKLGRYKEAFEAFDKAIEIDPKNIFSLFRKGETLVKLRRYEEALENFDKAIALYPGDPFFKGNRGFVLLKLRRYKEALKIFEEIIEVDKRNVYAWNNKGNALRKLEKHEKALEAFDEAIKIDKRNVYAWNNKGNTLLKFREYEEALKAFDEAIEIDPMNAYAWNNKGNALLRLRKYDGAIRAYEKAIKIDLNNAWPCANLGELYFVHGDLENAYVNVREALDRDDKCTLALLVKGKIEIEKENFNCAITSFRKTIHSNLSVPIPLIWVAYAKYLKAESSFKIGDKEHRKEIFAIIRELERANRLAEKEMKNKLRVCILYFLGYFYYRSGDIFASKERLEECIRLKSRKEKIEEWLRLKQKSPVEQGARELLDNIWNHTIKPTWWGWWLWSPVNSWIKRSLFVFLLFSVFSVLLLHPIIPNRLSFIKLDWPIYVAIIVLLIFFLLSPSIEKIKGKEVEVEPICEASAHTWL